MIGAFHGAMPSTTPQGWRSAMAKLPGVSEGMTSPVICVVMAAASRSTPAARCTLKPYQLAIAPVSAARPTNSAARLSSSSAARCRRLRRSFGGSAAQAGNACWAASTAASASSSVAAATRETTAPLSGLQRTKVLPSLAALASPPISNGTSSMGESSIL
ncbi:hypothetical protein D3C75_800010 [compost metagenome]